MTAQISQTSSACVGGDGVEKPHDGGCGATGLGIARECEGSSVTFQVKEPATFCPAQQQPTAPACERVIDGGSMLP